MGRLVLAREWNQEIVIGDPMVPETQISIKLTKARKGAKLVIEGPRNIPIHCREVIDAIQREAIQ